MSKAERSCNNLTHSWRTSSSVPAECLSGHTFRHRLLTGELAEESERRDLGRSVSPFRREKTDSIFRASLTLFYGLDSRRFVVSSKRSDPQWCLPCFIFRDYRGFFPRGYSGRFVQLTTHPHQMPILKTAGGTPPLPRSSWRPQ